MSAEKSRNLERKGAQLIQWNPSDEESLGEVFEGATIVVNALNSAKVPSSEKKQIAKVAFRSGPKVYFLSEFGV